MTTQPEMKNHLEAYRKSRDGLLQKIVTELSSDERFVAAWLTGSYARNDADEVSDLDLSLVIANSYSEILCQRQEQVSHKTTDERLALFRKFGEPALLHENNHNAPKGGTFTFVMYSNSALMVDWTLIPQTRAERPFSSLLLFDKANLPVSNVPKPEDREQRKKFVAEQWAFLWMMTAIIVKYIIRGDYVFVTQWLENLHQLIQEMERQVHSEPRRYSRGSLSQLQPTREKQIESIRSLCKRMQTFAPQIEHFCEMTLATPLGEIETLLALADEEHARH